MPTRFTDVHIHLDVLTETLVYPGPARVPVELLPAVERMAAQCKEHPLDDFTVFTHGATWRVRRDRLTVDGVWLRMRQIPQVAPRLDTLPSPLPSMLRAMLLSPVLTGEGLIYICGSAGSGKTTTASATVVSRLREFGGVAYTIEDPPEMPLNGWHGKGYCAQTSVAGEDARDWAESFRAALRSQPAATHQILFVGEIRNAQSAAAMLRAASNGFLVIATGFGADIVSAIDSLVKLTGDNAITLANMLRLVMYQRIRRGRLQVESLASTGAGSPVAARIRAGQLVHLASNIEYQRIQMLRGVNPLTAPVED